MRHFAQTGAGPRQIRPHFCRKNAPKTPYFAAALAQARKATLVTSDKDFERVGTALKILWV